MSLTDVHIVSAFVTLIFLALTVFIQKLKKRKWHHYFAYITLALIIATITIGIIMVLTGT